MYVWSGSAWVSVAAEVESLAGFATQSYADNTPGLRMVVPTSVAVGSGTGSVDAIGNVTFSGASSVSLNGAFSSIYDYYRILFHLDSCSADANFNIKMRASGTDNSSAQYSWGLNGRTRADTLFSFSGNAQTTGWKIGELDSGVSGRFYSYVIDMHNPFLAQNTLMQIISNGVNTSSIPYALSGGGFHEVATSYDGISLLPSSGTITGTIRVYGYKD
jgi:hypothetical protein